MRRRSTVRAANKRASRERILDVAAQRLRLKGLDGTAIAPVMAEAGLTHGAFYAHFASKDQLTGAAFAHALDAGRARWITPRRGESWRSRLHALAERYLTSEHRDDRANGCGFAALGSEAAHASEEFRAGFERELRTSLAAICGDPDGTHTDESHTDTHTDDAIALMAVCVGGLALARAVPDEEFSTRILRVARQAAATLAEASTTEEDR
ncbi:TetR/AcrR family transcriptional regulator [Mycolicibacterium palauense]|uniref:TetR/AcrR family transcriptional regulator n=1 Tax=Mycolicibacterium palauense TaxID=2034511 RepID=UPI00159BA41C|nr:TetR/AcrR family transcriptional regulator [Mycolicibacterium palauense]